MKRILKWVGGLVLAVIVLALGAGAYFVFINPSISMTLNKQSLFMVMDNPEALSSLGAVDGTLLDFHSGKLSDASWGLKAIESRRIASNLAELKAYDPAKLTGQDKLTYQVVTGLYESTLQFDRIAWLDASSMFGPGSPYPVNQMFGVQNNLPNFMQFSHVVINDLTARNYVARLNAVGGKFDQIIDVIRQQAKLGDVPPVFVIDKSIEGMRRLIAKPPRENILYTGYFEKLSKLDLDGGRKAELAAAAEKAITDVVYPAYQRLIAATDALRPQSSPDAGVWRLPDGDAFYAMALKQETTTDMSPEQVHQLGLSEVARIEGEMDTLLRSVSRTEGTVGARMTALGEDPSQLFEDSDKGREDILNEYRRILTDMKARLPDVFEIVPPQPLEVARVPQFSEAGTGGAYYNQPALDGSRPGRFFANLRDVKETPRFGMKTLAFHEGVPGHHFQIASAMNLDLPIARTMMPFTAYIEGWALYSERLAWEMGLYKDDPYGDLGRLQGEMFRAVRLVVDTGMHYKRWSREQAIDYMVAKTGMSVSDVTSEIERYAVMPGQACAYKIGMMKILELREKAKAALGAKFDLKGFHTAVLENGPLPLTVLEQVVDAWIAKRK